MALRECSGRIVPSALPSRLKKRFPSLFRLGTFSASTAPSGTFPYRIAARRPFRFLFIGAFRRGGTLGLGRISHVVA